MILLILSIGAVSAADISADNMTADTDVDLMLDDSPIERVSSTNVNADDWDDLKEYCKKTDGNYVISLTGSQYVGGTTAIEIKNSVTIIGSPNSYITGTFRQDAFVCSDSSLALNFINVTFKDISCNMLMTIRSNDCNFVNCTFDNIITGSNHASVIYNQQGTMSFDGCNFTNCRTSYGVITNYNTNVNAVKMSINNCNFINNTATTEPGAINNCGILNVTASNFINNNAIWWAGAIHTHYNAKTRIVGSNFIGNYAGWNGGALYTYSKLEIYNSTFKWNNCSTNNGGGAIGAYDYGSSYNLTVENCWFEDNNNLCVPDGRGGAISVSNGGILDVHGSTFINNNADIGQAICSSIIQDENSTNATPNLQIYNNTFINHTGSSNTVEIQNGTYLFENNVFINSVQNIPQQNTAGNIPLLMVCEPVEQANALVKAEPEVYSVFYVDGSKDGDGLTAENAAASLYKIRKYVKKNPSKVAENLTIYIANGEYDSFSVGEGEDEFSNRNVTVIGESRDGVIMTELNAGGSGRFVNVHPTYTVINITFKTNYLNRIQSNYKFINCTFDSIFILGPYDGYEFLDRADKFGNGVSNETVDDWHHMSFTFENCLFKGSQGRHGQGSNMISFTMTPGTPEGVNAYIYSYPLSTVNLIDCTFEDINATNLFYMELLYRNGNESINIVNPTIINCTYDTFVNATIQGLDTDDDSIVSITYRPEMNVSVSDSFAGDVNPVTIALPANATGEVTVTVNNKKYTADLENGAATIATDGLEAGEYTAVVDYAGDSNYTPTTKSATFTVNPKVQTAITPISGDATVKYGESHSVQLTADGNVILPNQEVTLTFTKDGQVVDTKTLTTSKFGTATFVNDLTPGEYNVAANFAGATVNGVIYSEANGKFTLTSEAIKPIIVGENMTLVTKVGNKFTILLKDENGKVLANQKVNFTIYRDGNPNTKTYTLTTDENGVAGLTIGLLMGKWGMTISVNDPLYEQVSENYVLTSVRNEAKIIAPSVNITEKGQLLKVQLVDQVGQALAGQKVTIHVGTAKYVRTTDANGIATLPIGLANNRLYNFFLSFDGTSLYTPCTGGTQVYTQY